MIVAQPKPFEAVRRGVGAAEQVLVAACAECVTVCGTGGMREAELLASALRLAARQEGRKTEVATSVIQRQCEPEFLATAAPAVEGVQVVVSLACGVGVGMLAEKYPGVLVQPAQDTVFGGGTVQPGIFEERCAFCGDCVLGETGGICPVARCAKRLFNGPCGGSAGGRCEVSEDLPCAWQEIHDRLAERGQLQRLDAVTSPKDWSHASDGGPRRMVHLP